MAGDPGEVGGAESPENEAGGLHFVPLQPKPAIARTPWLKDHLETLFGRRIIRAEHRLTLLSPVLHLLQPLRCQVTMYGRPPPDPPSQPEWRVPARPVVAHAEVPAPPPRPQTTIGYIPATYGPISGPPANAGTSPVTGPGADPRTWGVRYNQQQHPIHAPPPLPVSSQGVLEAAEHSTIDRFF